MSVDLQAILETDQAAGMRRQADASTNFLAAMDRKWNDVERLQSESEAVCADYLKGRTIGQGLAKLKLLLEQRGVCGRTMLPPLLTETDGQP